MGRRKKRVLLADDSSDEEGAHKSSASPPTVRDAGDEGKADSSCAGGDTSAKQATTTHPNATCAGTLEAVAGMAAAGEAAEEVDVTGQLPGSESAAESEVVPEPVSGEGQIHEQVVVHGEAGLAVESGVEAVAGTDAEGVDVVAEEGRPAAGQRGRDRRRRRKRGVHQTRTRL